MSLRTLYHRWKSLRLPWRKQFLVGSDLHGNTYWEFRDNLSQQSGRMRRIVKGPRSMHLSDIQAQISPLWHQWLRQTRRLPPSLEEQHADVQRQIVLKHNAALADARWEGKRKYIEQPTEKQRPEMQRSEEPRREMEKRAGLSENKSAQPNPWEQERQKEQQQQTGSNPGAGWQPEAWMPGRQKRG